MVDLASWLGEQLDKDRAALLRYRDGHEGPCINHEGQNPAAYDEYDSCVLHLEAANATQYRDVDFGLREIDVKRRILDECAYWHEKLAQAAEPASRPYPCLGEILDVVTPILRALALPYADRPGYREEWAP